VGVCDAAGYLLDVLNKYTGVPAYKDYAQMLDKASPDAVILATPTHLHAPMVREALDRNMHVFCEKPLFLELQDDVKLTEQARERGLVTQVGYHNRFVATFQEVHRLLRAGAIGTVNSALAEAYGPVVLGPAGRTWRSQRATGGGCLYDYAAHPIDLLTWYLGTPSAVSGSQLTSIFSTSIDDAVAATLRYETGTAQLCVNWSDASQRKMNTKITLWGTDGRIYADRQELHVYLRDTARVPEGYRSGWSVRYTTDMTLAPWFYLRGEEYSAQLDAFVQRVISKTASGENDFSSAAVTDRVIAMITADSMGEPAAGDGGLATAHGRRRPRSRPRRVAMAAAHGLRSMAQAARGESLA
jgi:predicted dehydrogenase